MSGLTVNPESSAALPLAGRRIVLGLSGGIACYKSAELTRELVKAGASVQVVMSDAARAFITPTTMQALSGRAVFDSQWDSRQANAMPHIDLTRDADAVLVAPASADFIARLAQGLADELLPLLCLARPFTVGDRRCPLLLAPAMNREMWAHPATQRNIAQVVADGAVVLGPGSGDQACGEVGDGRMLEAADLCDEMIGFFQAKLLAGRRVLISAGPTFEAIDPVRGLTNLSSGKMGFAIARAAQQAGAQVTLVAGPVQLETPRHVQRIDVRSALEMHAAILPLASQHDLFIATAAVADWRPVSNTEHKIKKSADGRAPGLELIENPDILADVAALANPPYCVGFAAETRNLAEHARAKLERKKLPLVVGNIGPDTFGRNDNALLLVDRNGDHAIARADKLSLARVLVAEIAHRISSRT
jgi:phosphopantothenoylcysteine decarboxylase/phosphopantothenate--cysteine ligase